MPKHRERDGLRLCHVLGLPGAGKSTLSEALAVEACCRCLSAGQWLRDRMAAGDSAVGEQLRMSATMDKDLFLRFLRESLNVAVSYSP
jgi:adenylate kinase family enzyme